MENAYEHEMERDLETMGQYMAVANLTEKQDVNLRLIAYKAGYSSPSDLLATIIRDITGWGGQGSPCAELLRSWYDNAHEEAKKTYYFRFYLYNYDYEMDDLEEMLSDMNIFVSDYQKYCDKCADEDLLDEPWERCLEVAKEILEVGGYV